MCEKRANSPFASMLKKWRNVRKLSQLELSLEARISQRHLSFLESGRSRPSKDMIVVLAETLKIPLRERNLMLKSAGFAPVYQERALDDAEMVSVKNALTITLQHHEPCPAVVVDRNWNLYLANRASEKLIALVGEPDASLFNDDKLNIYRFTFSHLGMRPFITNWSEIANPLILRLQSEVSEDPQNTFLQELLEEALSSSDTVTYSATDIANTIAPIWSLKMKFGDIELKMFNMVSTFGTALDVTASELKIETFFPADDITKAFFES
jgi:transcriptional regulator with XRE-family HTH domain